jgi:hypothetical protein
MVSHGCYDARLGRKEGAIVGKKSRFWLAALAAASLAVALAAGCSNDKGTSAKTEPPEIPPASTFVMDFSGFTATGLARLAADPHLDALPNNKANYSWAAGNVAVWNLIITVGLAVPVAAFLEAFRHEPVEETDGTWVWTYNVEVADIVYSAELHGKPTEDGVNWAMHISKEGGFSDFVWYTGVSNLPGTQGTWTLYKSAEEPTLLLGILWHRHPAQGTSDIKYTNIVPDGPENGGYIYYGITGGVPFDAFYDIYNKGLENLALIEWSRTAGNGRITDPGHFGDSDWHCWDMDQNDIACP